MSNILSAPLLSLYIHALPPMLSGRYGNVLTHLQIMIQIHHKNEHQVHF